MLRKTTKRARAKVAFATGKLPRASVSESSVGTAADIAARIGRELELAFGQGEIRFCNMLVKRERPPASVFPDGEIQRELVKVSFVVLHEDKS